MKITGIFIDEISHDIPHQNCGRVEWEKDFQHLKAIGIDTAIFNTQRGSEVSYLSFKIFGRPTRLF